MSEDLTAQAPILRATQVTKSFGGFTAVDGVDFTLGQRERVGLIATCRNVGALQCAIQTRPLPISKPAHLTTNPLPRLNQAAARH
jgi:hypothetical protein